MSHRQLFMLPSGAMVIDIPDMRELGLFSSDEGISLGYRNPFEGIFCQLVLLSMELLYIMSFNLKTFTKGELSGYKKCKKLHFWCKKHD